MVYLLLVLVAIFIVATCSVSEKSITNETIEDLNDKHGGNWYYDKESGSYRDSMTDREI